MGPTAPWVCSPLRCAGPAELSAGEFDGLEKFRFHPAEVSPPCAPLWCKCKEEIMRGDREQVGGRQRGTQHQNSLCTLRNPSLALCLPSVEGEGWILMNPDIWGGFKALLQPAETHTHQGTTEA